VVGGQNQSTAVHSEDSGTGAPYDEVYVPGRLDEDGQGVNVGREGGEEGVVVGDGPIAPPDGASAGVSYQDVYAEYADEAGVALEGSYIPLGMKQYVREYFSSLEPSPVEP
jgi:hypothetical protein